MSVSQCKTRLQSPPPPSNKKVFRRSWIYERKLCSKIVLLTGHFCANLLIISRVLDLWKEITKWWYLQAIFVPIRWKCMGCTIRWRSFGPHLPQKTLQKKARELEKVIRLSDMEKNVQRIRTPAEICTNSRMSTMKPK